MIKSFHFRNLLTTNTYLSLQLAKEGAQVRVMTKANEPTCETENEPMRQNR